FNDLTKLSSLILLEKHNISRMYLDSFFKINSVELNPIMEIDNMDLLIELTKLNLGVSCTIEEFVSKEVKTGALVKIDSLPPLPKRHIIMISNKNFSLSLAAQSFWDCLSNNCFNFLI
ncbi:LysR family transcriptional regulator substrate-binding protein, partial [Clostridium neonatale]